jgi:hypothetical protein
MPPWRARGSEARLAWPAVAPGCHTARVERAALPSFCPRLSDLPLSKTASHSFSDFRHVRSHPSCAPAAFFASGHTANFLIYKHL